LKVINGSWRTPKTALKVFISLWFNYYHRHQRIISGRMGLGVGNADKRKAILYPDRSEYRSLLPIIEHLLSHLYFHSQRPSPYDCGILCILNILDFLNIASRGPYGIAH
jgi:hypothetical protein